MARITVDIDEDLVADAKRLSGLGTKKAAVEVALREYVRSRRLKQLRGMLGNFQLDLTLDELRRMRGCDRLD